jgi:hypothetical protein
MDMLEPKKNWKVGDYCGCTDGSGETQISWLCQIIGIYDDSAVVEWNNRDEVRVLSRLVPMSSLVRAYTVVDGPTPARDQA